MSGGIRVWPDGGGVGRLVKAFEVDGRGQAEEDAAVWAIAVYLGVSERVVRGQLKSYRRILRARNGIAEPVEAGE